MKASVQLLTGCVALGLTLPATYGLAMTPAASAWTTATLATGQIGAGTDSRRAADDLLRQARKAIKEGQYEQADGLIAQAEKLNVKYDPLTARFVDTPEKLRKLLAEEKSKPAGGTRLPSLRFPALLGGSKTQAQPQSAAPVDPLAGKTGGVNPLADDSKSKAMGLLADARKALAAGDKFAALAAWQKAAALPVQYGPQEDSPQRLAGELVQAGIDPTHLTPAATSPAAPYALRPSDIDPSADRGPLLAGQPGAAAPPQFAQQMPANPYTLPSESNPLVQSAPGGGDFQPLDAQPAPGYQPPASTGPYRPVPGAPSEPRRFPMGDATKKADAARLIAQARVALDRGDLRAAQQLADQAQELNVPDEAFAADETRPWQLALEINRAMYRREGVVQASGVEPAGGSTDEPRYPVTQGVYDPNADTTKNMPASSQETILAREGDEVPGQLAPQAAVPQGPGYRLYDEGLRALEQRDREGALAKFTEAWKFQDQLDPAVRQQLKDKLTFLRAATAAQPLPAAEGQPSPLEQVNSQQEILRQKLVREIANEEKAAEALVETNPRGALTNLQKLRERVSAAEVEPAAKKQLLTLVDRRINQLTIYIEQNKATIENDDRNTQIKAELVRNQDVLIETQNKLAEMVEQFNQLLDERRFAEAEVIARQARDLAPTEPVVINMVEKSRLARSLEEQYATKAAKENYFLQATNDIDNAAAGNVGDANPLAWGPAKEWVDLTRSRRRLLDEKSRLSPAELEIQKSLSKLVEVKFDNRPLAEVMDTLSKMAGVNVYLDPQGMHAEGVTSDTPVSLNLTQPISLRSALSLVLEPLGLGHVIQHEVLRITSEQTRDANTYHEVYYVADLVMPIPNFVPSYNIGLPGAIRESLNALGYGGSIRPVSAGPLTIAQNELQQQQSQAPTGLAAAANPEVLAQAGMSGLMPAASMARNQSMAGPGGLGGGVQADFDTLIELITTTIAPQSWDEVGGPGSISGFDTNLSLVVSQTQEVHEQIADLLEQLRRLQDLQVTIEVRFITLSDRFFERIGVDFDFNIDDNTGLNTLIDFLPQPLNAGANIATPVLSPFDDTNHSIGIGWSTAGPTADLDLEFNQGSFASTTPQFGNFDANSAANFGFAILSDIEVFFVLQAGQGDDRTNVLQAPKVTLFNGQQAFVSDTSQRPFVTSVIPVVGDFAAAHQPVIVVLNEGTSLSVQAVVSSDRRFVRLTLVPFFSQIGDVEEFTFNGKVTTDSGTVVQDPSNPDQNVTNGQTRTVEGTTVQLPTFAFTTVTTTVSVPDGGTVLLGGIKRLREGRTERGVPLLSKVPYISRLFKNVGIGRDAQSLMMMVTPRIIIQEEEEEKLGIELPQ